jgi:UDP-2-acetamido-3-amino-2,3-dideoxy-glucuronate N-acetyltransferase
MSATRNYINIYGNGSLGEGTTTGEFVDIGGIVGKNCKIQAFVSIPPGVIVGDNVFIGPSVTFTNDKHPAAKQEWTQANTIVEDNVAIGANATILPVRLGNGCVIGAGSVVTKDVPAGETWVGNPAKQLWTAREDV